MAQIQVKGYISIAREHFIGAAHNHLAQGLHVHHTRLVAYSQSLVSRLSIASLGQLNLSIS